MPWEVRYNRRCDSWHPQSCPYIVDDGGNVVAEMAQTVSHPGCYDDIAIRNANTIVDAVKAWRHIDQRPPPQESNVETKGDELKTLLELAKKRNPCDVALSWVNNHIAANPGISLTRMAIDLVTYRREWGAWALLMLPLPPTVKELLRVNVEFLLSLDMSMSAIEHCDKTELKYMPNLRHIMLSDRHPRWIKESFKQYVPSACLVSGAYA